jgi:hypothetical protein
MEIIVGAHVTKEEKLYAFLSLSKMAIREGRGKGLIRKRIRI